MMIEDVMRIIYRLKIDKSQKIYQKMQLKKLLNIY